MINATTSEMRVALDLARASLDLRGEVLRLCVVAGLRPTRLVVTGPTLAREVVFHVVSVPDAFNISRLIPTSRVAPNQWSVETRDHDHIHVLATGIVTWLVVAGEIMPPWRGSSTDGPGTPIAVSA